MAALTEYAPFRPRVGAGHRPAAQAGINLLHRPALARRLVPVAHGVDTLHLFTRHPLHHGWVDQLACAKAAAQESDRPQVVTVAGLELQVRPYGTSGGAFLLESDLYAVKVAPKPKGEGSPTVSVELRALALWTNGYEAAAEQATDAMAELCRPAVRGAGLSVQVTRLDVCLDFQGWCPEPEDLDLFTCRVRRSGRGRHHGLKWLEAPAKIAAEKSRALALLKRLQAAASSAESAEVLRELHREDTDATVSTWGDARAFTGFSFGRGQVAARLYDKTRELSVSRKAWFRRVWRDGGRFDEEAPVWRLEFQLRREALVDFHEVAGGAPGEDAETWSFGEWAQVKQKLGALWHYLTTRWLRHGHRTAASRKVLSAPWARLVRWPSADVAPIRELHRESLREAATIALPQLGGYLTSAAAQLVELEQLSTGHRVTNAAQPFSSLVVQALVAAHAYAEGKERPLEAKFRERRAKYANRRKALSGTKHSKAAHALGASLELEATAEFCAALATRGAAAGEAAQRYGTHAGVLVRRDESDDAAEELARRARAEVDNALSGLARQRDAAQALGRFTLAAELGAELLERQRRAGLLTYTASSAA